MSVLFSSFLKVKPSFFYFVEKREEALRNILFCSIALLSCFSYVNTLDGCLIVVLTSFVFHACVSFCPSFTFFKEKLFKVEVRAYLKFLY